MPSKKLLDKHGNPLLCGPQVAKLLGNCKNRIWEIGSKAQEAMEKKMVIIYRANVFPAPVSIEFRDHTYARYWTKESIEQYASKTIPGYRVTPMMMRRNEAIRHVNLIRIEQGLAERWGLIEF